MKDVGNRLNYIHAKRTTASTSEVPFLVCLAHGATKIFFSTLREEFTGRDKITHLKIGFIIPSISCGGKYTIAIKSWITY